MDPAQWMALLQQGDSEALERLLTHYDGMLRYIAGGILEAPQDREDCLAQVRLKLWESRGQYDPERSSPATWLTALCRKRSSPATWLTALCRNAAVDHLRRLQRQGCGELPEAHPDPAPGPEEHLLQKERIQALERALNTLSARDRNLVYRKYYYLQSTARMAAELGLTERAVEGRLYRIRRKLQKQLGGEVL